MIKKKQKIFLGIMLLLLISPMAGLMMANSFDDGVGVLDTPLELNKSYASSADCVITAGDSGVTNADDTDNLYGGAYRAYTVTANCSYGTRGADIDNITVSFYKGAIEYFSFVYDNDTETATEDVGASFVTIGTVSNVTTGIYANITIAFEVEWAMTDVDDVDLNITAWNGVNSTSTQKNADYDFDTDLVMTPTSFISLVSTKVNDPIAIATTTISYEDSGGDNYPLDAETDFVLTRTPATGADSWNPSSYTDGTGVAVWITVTAGYIAQQETFTMTAYTQGTTTTNLYGTTYTDSVSLTNSGGAVHEPDVGIAGIPPQYIFLGIGAGVFLWYRNKESGGQRRGPTKRKKGKKR